MPKTRKRIGGAKTALNMYENATTSQPNLIYPPHFYENYENPPFKQIRHFMNDSHWRSIHYEMQKSRLSNIMSPIYNSIDEKYKSNNILPKGTILYRATFEENPCTFLSLGKDFVYFGLDYVIAVWYIKEALDSIHKGFGNIHTNVSSTDTSYLHVYQLTRDLEYYYVNAEDTLNIKAKLGNVSNANKNIIQHCYHEHCVNPQHILHGISPRGFHTHLNIGTELTMLVKNSKDLSISDYLQPTVTYTVNQKRLSELDAKRKPTLVQNISSVLDLYRTYNSPCYKEYSEPDK